jgi:multiple sugar transport system ATP-binding protein
MARPTNETIDIEMAHLALTSVKKSFGPLSVIHGVDLEVNDGEFVVFVGPSGCGKSTLLRLIAGLDLVTDGDIAIDGKRMNDVPASDRGLAMVFQSYALYPHMSVYRNMAFGLENMGLPGTEVDKRVRRAAAMLRLSDYLDRKPKALSGGQRQRVAIGRAIVREPKIFLFDEPLSNLDAELRVAMRKELAALHAEIRGTIIYVTHDQVEAMTLASRIVVLRSGRIEQIGAPLDLYNRPANLFVATFIGSPKMNILPATVLSAAAGQATLSFGAGNHLTIADEGGRLTEGMKISIGIRPEHCDLVDGSEAADLEVTVDLAEHLGGETYFYCSAPGPVQLTIHESGQLMRARGDTLRLRFRREHLHLFDAEERALYHGANAHS